MYQTASEFFHKRGIALQQPCDPAAPVAPMDDVNGFLLFDGCSGPLIKRNRKCDEGHRSAFIEGDFELYPPTMPGAASNGEANCGQLLLAAGMKVTKDGGAKTIRYAPTVSVNRSPDVYCWHANAPAKFAACRPRIKQLGIAIGDRFKGRIRIQGDSAHIQESELPPSMALDFCTPSLATYANTSCRIAVLGGSPLTTWAESLVLNFDRGNACPSWTLRLARTARKVFDPHAARDAGKPLIASLRLMRAPLYSEIGVRGRIENIKKVIIHGGRGWEISGRAAPNDTGGAGFHIEFGDIGNKSGQCGA